MVLELQKRLMGGISNNHFLFFQSFWLHSYYIRNQIAIKTITFSVKYLSHAMVKKCNGIIKRWLHCLNVRVKRKISCQLHIITMMSSLGVNLFFFNKKKWMRRTLANAPPPFTSDNISFLPYTPTLTPSKWMSCVYHPYIY